MTLISKTVFNFKKEECSDILFNEGNCLKHLVNKILDISMNFKDKHSRTLSLFINEYGKDITFNSNCFIYESYIPLKCDNKLINQEMLTAKVKDTLDVALSIYKAYNKLDVTNDYLYELFMKAFEESNLLVVSFKVIKLNEETYIFYTLE